MKYEQQFKDDLREAYLSVIKKHYGEHGLKAIAMFEIHTFSDEKILKDFGTSGLEALQWYRIMKHNLSSNPENERLSQRPNPRAR